jgi:hypothetical protein
MATWRRSESARREEHHPALHCLDTMKLGSRMTTAMLVPDSC